MKATTSTTSQLTQALASASKDSGSATRPASTTVSSGIFQAPNLSEINAIRDSQGNTLLHYAVYQNKLKRVEALLQAGARVNAANWEGQTALHFAVKQGSLELIRLLIAFGAQINVQDLKGKAPGTLAFEARRSDILTVLQTAANQHVPIHSSLAHEGSQIKLLNYHADQLKLRQQIARFMFEEDKLQTSRSTLEACLSKLWLEHRKLVEDVLLQAIPAPKLMEPKQLIETLYDKLSIDSTLFGKLNALLALLKSLQSSFAAPQEQGKAAKRKNSAAYEAVDNALQQIVNTYEKFRRDYCEGDAVERKELQQLPTSVSGFGIGHRFIMAEFAPNFRMEFKKLSGSATLIKAEKTGTHRVIRLGDAYFKINPDAPGIEFAIDSLNKILTRQGSAPTELLVVSPPGEEPLAVLASQAVEGMSFLDALKKQPLCGQAISDYHFSLQMILSLLTNPSDAKPDNFIATGSQDASGLWQSMELVGIDNDHAFAYPISAWTDKHYLEIKSIFYCLPQMENPVSKVFIEKIMSQSPWQVTMAWLKSLVLKNRLYESYQSLLPAATLQQIGIPLRLVPGTAENLYQTMVNLQKILIEQPSITHHALLRHFHPLVAAYYAYLRCEYSDNPYAGLAQIYSGMLTYEVLIQEGKLQLDEAELAALKTHNKKTFDYEDERIQPIEQACEAFLASLDFRTLSQEEQGQLLDQLAADFPFLQTLTISHCNTLTDAKLESLAKRLSHLRSFSLIHCPKVSIAGLSAILSYHPELSLTLEGFEELSVEDWLTIAHATRQLTLTLLNGERHTVHYQNNLLLQTALEQQYDVITEFLLRYGVQLNFTEALHKAAEQGSVRIIQALLHYGAPINYRNRQGDTALDVAALHGRVESAAILLRQGAITCRKDRKEVILAYGLKVLKQYPMDTLLHQQLLYFARTHQLLNYENLAQLLLPSITVLDISGSSTLTDEMVQILVEKQPALEVINLSDCQALSLAKLHRLEAGKIKDVYITFNQAVACGIIDHERIAQLNNLKINDRMAIHISHFNPEKPFTQEQIKQLSMALKRNNDISILTLWKAKLQSQDIIELASGIQFSHVRALYMERSQVDKSAMAALAEALKQHAWVKELRLDACGITEECAKELYTLLVRNTTLEILSLYDNNISHRGLASIGSGLLNHSSLIQLNINQNHIDTQSAILFIETLHTCSKLQSLDIGYNGLTEEAGRALLRLIKKRGQLQDVRYGGNNFSDRLDNQLRLALLENQQASQRESQHYYVQMHETCLQNAPRYLLAARQVRPIRPPRPDSLTSPKVLSSHRHTIVATTPYQSETSTGFRQI